MGEYINFSDVGKVILEEQVPLTVEVLMRRARQVPGVMAILGEDDKVIEWWEDGFTPKTVERGSMHCSFPRPYDCAPRIDHSQTIY